MNSLQAPIASVEETILELHDDKRIDPYFWMRNIEDPRVIPYLKDENDFLEQSFAHRTSLREQLFEEMKGRIKEDDASTPMQEGEFWYYYRYQQGQQYPLYCRRKGAIDGPEEVILDQNLLAEGKSFLELGFVKNSPDHKFLAYSCDEDGDESYRFFIKNLETGDTKELGIERGGSSFVWLKDSKSFIYSAIDDHYRPRFAYLGHIDGDADEHQKIYEEKDSKYFLSLSRSEDNEYLFIDLHGNNSSEVWWSHNNSDEVNFQLFEKRSPDHEYDLTHLDGKFLILSNWQAENYAIYQAEPSCQDRFQWLHWQSYQDRVLTESITIYQNFIAIEEKINANPRIRVIHRKSGEERLIQYGDDPCELDLISPRDYSTNILRFAYSSMKCPSKTYDFNMLDGSQVLMKEQEVPDKNFNTENYVSKRIYIEGSDGTNIPVSLLYRKDREEKAEKNLLLYAYGAYGASMDAGFSTSRFSFVDRGFCYAIAHVRGGMELGRRWYLDGKLKKKMNTFTDFIDVAEGLIHRGITEKGKIVASGGSAGGLLMGAISNMRPDLFGAVIAAVPFVDVLTTMLDDSLPLTTIEYNEWGNPQDKDYYDYIKAYSPYDNVRPQEYPAILVICGLNDMRVTYWEPAKWVAKLRVAQQGNQPIYLMTHMDAGHGGASGRYDYLKDSALELCFALEQMSLG